MQALWSDLRHSVRVLLKAKGFAAAAILILALGIEANSAIFSVVNAVLLRPLPFADSDRLVEVYHAPPARSFPGVTKFSVSPANFLDWRSTAKSFDAIAGARPNNSPQVRESAAVTPRTLQFNSACSVKFCCPLES